MMIQPIKGTQTEARSFWGEDFFHPSGGKSRKSVHRRVEWKDALPSLPLTPIKTMND